MTTCNNGNSNANGSGSKCPPKVIPITRPGNERTKAFGYARLVNNAFGTTSRGYRSQKQIVKLNTDVYGSAAGAPGGTRSPPRNF